MKIASVLTDAVGVFGRQRLSAPLIATARLQGGIDAEEATVISVLTEVDR